MDTQNNVDIKNQPTKIRFEYDDDEEAGTLEEVATESSNLEEDTAMCEPEDSFAAGDDKTSADYYFDSYSHFGIHEEMLKDVVRTKTYQNVIYKNSFLFKDKVVLDVGAGTGILSLFCAKVGAKHVYAVECSSMADMAQEIVKLNGYSNVITVLKGKIEEIELPVAQVDVIISEWMGCVELLHFHAVTVWNNVYGFDMSCIRKQSIMEPLVDTVEQNQIVTNCQLLKTMDISKMTAGDASFTAPFKLVAERDDYIHALVAYFDVSFTKCHKLMGFSTGPKSRATHWKQTVLYLEDVLSICQGEAVIGTLTVAPNKKNPRDVDITLKYSLNGRHCQASRTQYYRMR
ncbi:protein arginine N-methyltransferase 1.1 [Sesamum angolense]|uniref:Protein arginine N-methyltransferase 1.1 n=1 Tax=Sesamum angolense TaxID=2727404 RepID=A0AAE2BT86_9LAMI|nr:protein arginine N-methyltransferase 1.1 [Sesamum angolense]